MACSALLSALAAGSAGAKAVFMLGIDVLINQRERERLDLPICDCAPHVNYINSNVNNNNNVNTKGFFIQLSSILKDALQIILYNIKSEHTMNI